MFAQIDLHHVPLCINATRRRNRHYEERVRNVEQASFVSVVMSASGGMGKAASALYGRVAALLAAKKFEQYRHIMAYVQCKLSFSLLVLCVSEVAGNCSHVP